MGAVVNGKLDCLDHLIAKGANLEAADKASAAPSATFNLLLSLALCPRRPPLLLPRPRLRR